LFNSWKSRAAVLAVAVTMSIPALGIASPAGAAEDAAKAACKGDGWKTLVRADGTAFKNQGDCASYSAAGGQVVPDCLGPSEPGFDDLQLTGPLDTADNTSDYNSENGSCSLGIDVTQTIVTANDFATAQLKCVDIYSSDAKGPLSDHYPSAPPNWWICLQFRKLPV
jgi:hypothetical protein